MSTKKTGSTLLGRRCVIDFACRWKGYRPPHDELQRKEYQTREDWNKTGEIVGWDQAEHKLYVLRDDTGNVQDYYAGEITVTGPAPKPEAELLSVLTEIRDLLRQRTNETQCAITTEAA